MPCLEKDFISFFFVIQVCDTMTFILLLINTITVAEIKYHDSLTMKVPYQPKYLALGLVLLRM